MALTLEERCNRSKSGTNLLTRLLGDEASSSRAEPFDDELLTQIAKQTGLTALAILQGTKGQWRILARFACRQSPPELWLGEVLDSAQSQQESPWFAASLPLPDQSGLVLAAQGNLSLNEFDSIAAAVTIYLRLIRSLQTQTRRATRWQHLLNLTVSWQQHQSTIELLQQIAEASTQWLQAERATIFLLDPIRQVLVGRPALGIETGELIVPRNAGVVGQVVESGQALRVDADIASEQALVDRQFDRQLKFQTRSLLCVPLRNAQGKIIGAFELINKIAGNFSDDDQHDLEELAAHAAVAIGNTQQIQQLVESRKQAANLAAEKVRWIGRSPEIQKVKQTIERVANTELVVLITGENGTGKEIAAQMVHYLSARRDQMLVAVNCAAISETLLESELFGHEKGAFTDAYQTRIGKFELADRGTLFLDEIGDMSLAGQAKLLRVLEEKVVVRVGGSTPIPTSARVIAATNQNLAELVRDKKFREDLFFRLNVVNLALPPLRARGTDVVELANHFIQQFSALVRRPTPVLTRAAEDRLLAHHWPGNIRELRNMMERLVYLSTEPTIDVADLEFIIAPRRESMAEQWLDLPLAAATDQFQKQFIQRQIDVKRGNMTEAARQLGLHRSNLYRKMRQLGMEARDDAE